MNTIQQMIYSKYLEEKDMDVINNIDNDISMGFLQAEYRIKRHESAHSLYTALVSAILQTQLWKVLFFELSMKLITSAKSEKIITRLKEYLDFSHQYPIERSNKKIKMNFTKNHQLLKQLNLKTHILHEEHLCQYSEEAELLNKKLGARYLRILNVIEKQRHIHKKIRYQSKPSKSNRI